MTTWYPFEGPNHDCAHCAQETCFQHMPTLSNHPQNCTHHRCFFFNTRNKPTINPSNTARTKEYNRTQQLCTNLYTHNVNINTKLQRYYKFSYLFKIVTLCAMVRKILQCIAWDKATAIRLAQFSLNILKTELGTSEQRSLLESLYFSFRILKRRTLDTVQGLNRAQCEAASSESYRTVM